MLFLQNFKPNQVLLEPNKGPDSGSGQVEKPEAEKAKSDSAIKPENLHKLYFKAEAKVDELKAKKDPKSNELAAKLEKYINVARDNENPRNQQDMARSLRAGLEQVINADPTLGGTITPSAEFVTPSKKAAEARKAAIREEASNFGMVGILPDAKLANKPAQLRASIISAPSNLPTLEPITFETPAAVKAIGKDLQKGTSQFVQEENGVIYKITKNEFNRVNYERAVKPKTQTAKDTQIN